MEEKTERHFPAIHANDKLVDFALAAVIEHNLGQRGEFDGDRDKQYFGLIAQALIMQRLGLGLPKLNGFDGGFDFEMNGKKWDVKCKLSGGRPHEHHQVCFPASQMKFDNDFILFLQHPKICPTETPFYVLGYISKSEFKQKARFRAEREIGDTKDDGSIFIFPTDSWQIGLSQLHELKRISEIKKMG